MFKIKLSFKNSNITSSVVFAKSIPLPVLIISLNSEMIFDYLWLFMYKLYMFPNRVKFCKEISYAYVSEKLAYSVSQKPEKYIYLIGSQLSNTRLISDS